MFWPTGAILGDWCIVIGILIVAVDEVNRLELIYQEVLDAGLTFRYRAQNRRSRSWFRRSRIHSPNSFSLQQFRSHRILSTDRPM